MASKSCKPGCIAKHDRSEQDTTAGFCFTAPACPICFQPEGEHYAICPNACPYGGDQKVEETDFVPDANPYGFDDGDTDGEE